MKILCSRLPAKLLEQARIEYSRQWYRYTEEELKTLHVTIAFRRIGNGPRQFHRSINFGERSYQHGRYMRTIPIVMDKPIGLFGSSDG